MDAPKNLCTPPADWAQVSKPPINILFVPVIAPAVQLAIVSYDEEDKYIILSPDVSCLLMFYITADGHCRCFDSYFT